MQSLSVFVWLHEAGSLLLLLPLCLVWYVNEFNRPTLWGSSVKLGRSRLPASAWLSWSTSYMLYDGLPISTFIPPLVMGCLWTRFPLRCVEPAIIHMTQHAPPLHMASHNKSHNTSRHTREYITSLCRPRIRILMADWVQRWAVLLSTLKTIRTRGNRFVSFTFKTPSASSIVCCGAQDPLYNLFLFFFHLFTYLCLRLQMYTPTTTVTIKITSRTRGTMIAMLPER